MGMIFLIIIIIAAIVYLFTPLEESGEFKKMHEAIEKDKIRRQNEEKELQERQQWRKKYWNGFKGEE